ncbi:hypothetical protein MTR67_031522 [Solanum verrucosum]|uniref:DUF3444 domain-containing protein n=1 Tax=Solanum verrucosum TaxID=315347 RepID=A0AAF0U2J7_SOLVR|nr:hypothetical protein MTR67_031522 [Solanum verrucosum]
MTEKGDFPEGSFELDPDSLATYQLGIFASYIDQRATTNFMDSVNYAENWVASVPNQVPKPEFYKFADERSREKFQIGQYVKFLALVKGFKSIYMARAEEEEADKVVKVCASEHLRFSHQIPAFCLTEERGGSLRGFWELDPVEMPSYLVCTD